MIKIARFIKSSLTKLPYTNFPYYQISVQPLHNNQVALKMFFNNNTYFFSDQKKQQNTSKNPTTTKQKPKKKRSSPKYEVQSYSPLQYYRNIIRRINIKQTGKGKFNPIKFLKLISLCKTPEHGKILFQAYYNILGHFTMLPNKIIDELILKTLTIGADISSILEVYKNHVYLGYYPHYKATNKALKTISQNHDQNTLKSFLITLICSPLIKINHQIVHTLENIYIKENTSEVLRKNIIKFLIYRKNQVKQFFTNAEFNAKICYLLQQIPSSPIQGKTKIKQHIQSMLSQANSSNEELINKCIIASAFNFIQNAGNALAASGQQLSIQHEKFFIFLKNQYQLSNKELNYAEILENCLRETKISIQNLKKIQQLKLLNKEKQSQVQEESK